MEDAPPSSPAVPNTGGLHQSWAMMNDESDTEVEEEKKGPAATRPSPPAPVTSTAVPYERDYVPSYLGKLKLLDVGLDPRMDTALLVTLHVDQEMPSPPQVERSRFALSRDGKRKLVALLLGSNTGFAIKLPDIPRVLVAGATTETVLANCNNLTGPKAEWWNTLRKMTHQYGSLIREFRSDDGAREKASNGLWEHLEKVNSLRSTAATDQLWTAVELTRSWMDVVAPASDIMNDRERGGRSYTLKLHGITPEVTYILACLFTSFASLPEHNEGITAAFDQVLHGSSSAGTRAARTDSDSGSDVEDGWRRAPTRRRTRPGIALEKRLAAFAAKHLCTTRYTADSGRPMLQMATTVLMRPWEHRYICCDVSNWESIGCTPDDEALVTNANFVRVTTALPELASPMARWVVHQRCGFYTVNLFVREDCKDVVAKLNDRLRTVLGISTVALGVSCWLVRRSRGRVISNSQVRISLTPEIPRKLSPHQQRRAVAMSSYADASPPPLDSWAGRVLEGIRRSAPSNTLDHRPRKQLKPSPLLAQPPPPTSASVTTAVPRDQRPPVAVTASSDHLHTGATIPEPHDPRETPLPPALVSLRKMVDDSNRRIDTLLDIPRQIHALSGRLAQMEMASTASAEVMTTIQMKMEQIAISMVAMHEEVRRLSAAYPALPSIGAAVPVHSLSSVTDATIVPHELTYAAVAATQRAAVDAPSVSPSPNPLSVMAAAAAGAGPLYSSGQHIQGSPIAAHSASASPARHNGSAVRNV
jgi:hypothetical protein